VNTLLRHVPALALLAASGLSAQQPSLVLTDVTRAAGIDWVQVENNTMMGAGAAFLDFDGDGWEDVLLVGGDAEPGLFRNLGGAAFVRVTPTPLRGAIQAETMCVAVGDIDNDGDPDVFIGRFGPNQLFRNDGGGTFTELTTPELAGPRFGFTTTAAFGDFDADGCLDLYIGNYIAPGSTPPNHTPMPNHLFRGRGDGTFVDVTSPVVAGAGTALATAWSDFDGDGDVDILLANDFGATVEPNRIYRNEGPAAGGWAFSERSAALGADLRIFCMGIAIGDYDRDGDLDAYYTNMGRNVFLRNDRLRFADVTEATGTDLTWDEDTSPRLLATSWGTGLHDFDNDGWLDLYVANGHIPADPNMANGLRTRDVLFRHDGPSLRYSRVTQPLSDGVGRGVAFADFDQDGDVDVLQANVGAAPVLWRNDSPRRGRWAEVRLRGRLSNRDAIGARVELEIGEFVAVRELRRNDSYQSASSARLHFGLGANDRIRRARLRWPSGVEQELHDLAVDRVHDLVEPLVTVDDARLRTFDLRVGTLLLFKARLRAHADGDAPTAVFPQLRGPDGAVLWQGDPSPVRLRAGQLRPAVRVLFVPRHLGDPLRMGLTFVWSVADTTGALDESALLVR
jgi:hypothetical protein